MLIYKFRLTKPEKGNKYYITRKSGGYNPCIVGNPTDSDCNVLANCVGYAVGRFNEIGAYGCCKWLASVNAENMLEIAKNQGLSISPVPTLGGCMVWQKGNTLSGSDGAGHVAIVEAINADGSIITSESGYGYKAFYTTKRHGTNYETNSAYKFRGCIVNPAVHSSRILYKGCEGADVQQMQRALYEKGYLRKSEIDGDFGKITLGAVLAFQFENKLQVDGVCGQKTKTALKIV
jgi:surface antigen